MKDQDHIFRVYDNLRGPWIVRIKGIEHSKYKTE